MFSFFLFFPFLFVESLLYLTNAAAHRLFVSKLNYWQVLPGAAAVRSPSWQILPEQTDPKDLTQAF